MHPVYVARTFSIIISKHRNRCAHSPLCRIGDVSLNKKLDSHPALVPNVVFHDMQCHVKILKDMLTDWSCGENFLLLIGNQGVGKNKLADKLVQMLNFEREYIQVCLISLYTSYASAVLEPVSSFTATLQSMR